MRFRRCVIAFALLSAGLARALADDAATEAGKLEGQWRVAHRAYKDSKANADVSKILLNLGTKVEIKDGKLSSCDPDKAGRHLDVEFDGTVTPKTVDLTVPGKQKRVLLGIYRLEDDLLALALRTAHER